jgi:phospholipid/cholesterol/gamma-HCH transport system permease protein
MSAGTAPAPDAAPPDAAAGTAAGLEPGDAPGEWRARGRWTALAIGELAARLASDAGPGESPDGGVVVDGARVEALDSVGALLLARWAQRAAGVRPWPGAEGRDDTDRPDRLAKRPATWRNFTDAQRQLLERVAVQPPAANAEAPPEGTLVRLGRGTVDMGQETFALLSFLGESTIQLFGEVAHPWRFRWRSVLHHVGETGVAALPIVGLLGLLMGIVVAYQGAEQLARYGANIFVVDLVGLSMLREFAPLVTAIIVAGRSGSAFAAQLGTMAVTEEIDALRALGLAPLNVLVLPRLVALVLVLPLLTLFADALGVLGGMVMATLRLHVTFSAFLERLPHAVSATTLMLGIGKTPVFAGIIAVVGCYQGLRTQGGADSVGRQTTRSVVQSIFLVIVADAVFSVAFSMLDL